MKRFNNFQKVPDLLQGLLNICLFFLALALSVLLISETWYIVQFVYKNVVNKGESYYEMLGELLIFFMYFEFIALIIKYFKS
ncbi:phosphate-starvation-inducible PsiE family protein, partial [Bacillus sp. SIMBA_008]